MSDTGQLLAALTLMAGTIAVTAATTYLGVPLLAAGYAIGMLTVASAAAEARS